MFLLILFVYTNRNGLDEKVAELIMREKEKIFNLILFSMS